MNMTALGVTGVVIRIMLFTVVIEEALSVLQVLF